MWVHIDTVITHNTTLTPTPNLLSATRSDIVPYNQNRMSFLTYPNTDFFGFERLSYPHHSHLNKASLTALSGFPDDWPELELEVTSAVIGSFSVEAVANIIIVPITPLSRGNITLNPTDAADQPIITRNWFTDPTDRDLAVQSVKRVRGIFANTSIKGVLTGKEVLPGSRVQSDTEIEGYIEETLVMNWHASCACKMGKISDPMADVDSRPRVKGVQGLRVVDASAFPLLPPRHLQSAVYMLAEKIAKDILRGNQGGT